MMLAGATIAARASTLRCGNLSYCSDGVFDSCRPHAEVEQSFQVRHCPDETARNSLYMAMYACPALQSAHDPHPEVNDHRL